jgi:hypothetical protein
MATCSCDVLLGNAGSPGCVPIHGVGRKLIRVPLIATDGTDNKILLTDTLDAAYWAALVNNADTSKRFYPTPVFKTFTQERADNITEDFDDGSSSFIRDGVKTVTAFITKAASPQLVGVLEDDRCTNFGVYIVDDAGNLIGRDIGDGYLYPIPVDNGSWAPTWVEPTDTTTAKVNLVFNFSTLFKDSNLGFIGADSFTDISLLNLGGLLDVVITATVPTALGVTLQLANIYGASNSKLPVTGLDLTTAGDAEMVLINTSDSNSAVGIDSALESPDGTYTVVYTVADAPSSTDIIQGTVSKNGLDDDSQTWVTA